MNELDSITLNVGAVYKDDPKTSPGFTTYVDGEVDTSTPGTYTVTYTLIKTEPAFETETWTREVTVVEVSSGTPTIILEGDSYVTIEEGEDWQDPGAQATTVSSSGETVSVEVFTTSSVDYWPNATSGSYSILYHAVSSTGEIGFAIRTVNVGVEYRDPTQNTATPGFTLNQCEKLFVEYPTGTTKPIYVGADYTGVAAHIIQDAGFTLDDPDDPTFVRVYIAVEDTSNESCTLDYSNKADCEAAGGTWGYASTFPQSNEVYFEADQTVRKEFNIKYTISDIYGNLRTLTRTVVMLAEGEQAEELDQQLQTGCLLNDDKKDIGDVIQEDDDPTYEITEEPTVPLNDISEETLDIICAGGTAFFGTGPLVTQKDFHDYEIPETIIETRFVSASGITGVQRLFITTYDVPLPSGGTAEMRSEGVSIWRLYKVHNRNLVTYSLGMGGFTSDPNNGIIFSSFHIGTPDGDIFYGRWGTHIFHGNPGWNRSVQQKSIAWGGGRTLPAPASFTEVTDELNADWVARASSTNNEPEKYVFYDEDQTPLNLGGVVHSSPMFRGFYDSIKKGGASNPGDVLSLHWHVFGGGRTVEEYCQHEWRPPTPSLNLYCNVHREAHPKGISPPSEFVVPIGLYEIGWDQHNCYQNTACPEFLRTIRLDNITTEYTWSLVKVNNSFAAYALGTGETANITNDGSGLTFTGKLGTYTWDTWEYGNDQAAGANLWMTNFSNKITSNAPSGRANRSLGLYTSTAGNGSWYAWYNPWTSQGSWPASHAENDGIFDC